VTHLSPSILALYAGQDLNWFARWRAERHLAGCRRCRDEVVAFSSLGEDLAELNAIPALPWNRMAAEMKANIRLGLEAGECVREFEGALPLEWLTRRRAFGIFACVAALLVAGFFLQPSTPPALPASPGEAVLRATPNGIELNQGGQSLSLLHVRAENVTYSAGAQGSMRARYVDADTGNVTINNLYVQ
jgi:hypothetical protein